VAVDPQPEHASLFRGQKAETSRLRHRDVRNPWVSRPGWTTGAGIGTVAIPEQVCMALNLRRSPHEVAPELIGAELSVDGVGGVIVEVEAYDHEDPAAHGFGNRRTARNASMFLAGGHAYVYRSYGLHWCLNVVCCEEGTAGAVLVRALEPIRGLEQMAARRGVRDARLLCSGPGRLCQALGVTRAHDGLRLDRPPFELRPRRRTVELLVGPRIGITKAVDRPWHYGLAGSRFVSRPFPGS
jgi:DNA-3-methyladenine glycosylase